MKILEMTAIEIGDIVDAIVVSVQPFGLFVEANGVWGLILLPELSWQRVAKPESIAQASDKVRCKVMHLSAPGSPGDAPRFTASIREVHPELDPWRDPSVFAVGTEFSGVVERHMSYGIFIQHPRQTLTLLHTDDYDSGSAGLNVGDSVDVVITNCDVVGQQISVRLK